LERLENFTEKCIIVTKNEIEKEKFIKRALEFEFGYE